MQNDEYGKRLKAKGEERKAKRSVEELANRSKKNISSSSSFFRFVLKAPASTPILRTKNWRSFGEYNYA